jgi:hypothetical protein
MKWTPLLVLALLLAGCQPPAEAAKPEAPPENPQASQTTTSQPAGDGGGIRPYTGTPLPNAPIQGAENVGGAGGGGVGQAAKDRAKRAAGQAGGSSLDQMGGE